MDNRSDSRRVPTIKKRRMSKHKKNWIKPILGIHTKYDLRVMDEIKPPFTKKTHKRLQKARYKK